MTHKRSPRRSSLAVAFAGAVTLLAALLPAAGVALADQSVAQR